MSVNNTLTALLYDTGETLLLQLVVLRKIVKLTEIPEAKHLIDAYKKCLCSKSVSEVWLYFKVMYFDQDHFPR